MIHFKRKKYVVDKNQLQFCLRIVVISMLPLLVLSLTALVVCFRFKTAQQLSFIWENPGAFLESMHQFAPHFILAFFFGNVAITWFSLLVYSNRVFGPIHGLAKKVGKVVSGEIDRLPPLRFRKDDEFTDLVSLLNQLNYGEKPQILSSEIRVSKPALAAQAPALIPTEVLS